MRIPRYQVDAFASQPFTGNPAAVCPLDRWLDDTTLQKVAAENNLSATAFFVPQPTHFELRWFTPLCEIKLCGHATLASAYVILNLLQPDLATVHFKTSFSGGLTVAREGELFSMDFPALVPKACAGPSEALSRALGPGPLPSEILEANETFIVIYDSESVVRNARPSMARLRDLHPYAIAITAPGDKADFVSRYFAPSYGVPEDPVTGSVHRVLTPFWAQRLGKKNLYAQQLSDRGGELWCDLAGDRVTLKGKAVLILQGLLEF